MKDKNIKFKHKNKVRRISSVFIPVIDSKLISQQAKQKQTIKQRKQDKIQEYLHHLSQQAQINQIYDHQKSLTSWLKTQQTQKQSKQNLMLKTATNNMPQFKYSRKSYTNNDNHYQNRIRLYDSRHQEMMIRQKRCYSTYDISQLIRKFSNSKVVHHQRNKTQAIKPKQQKLIYQSSQTQPNDKQQDRKANDHSYKKLTKILGKLNQRKHIMTKNNSFHMSRSPIQLLIKKDSESKSLQNSNKFYQPKYKKCCYKSSSQNNINNVDHNTVSSHKAYSMRRLVYEFIKNKNNKNNKQQVNTNNKQQVDTNNKQQVNTKSYQHKDIIAVNNFDDQKLKPKQIKQWRHTNILKHNLKNERRLK